MKTLNAILPNAGVAAAYRRELDALIDNLFEAYRANMLSEIIGMAASGEVKAADAKPKTPEEAEEVFKAKAAVIAAKFAKKAGRHVEAGLIQAMKKAGFTQADLRRLRQDKTAYAAIEQQIINNNVALITRIPADVEAKIRKMVERSIEKDRDLGGLVKELDTLQEMTHRRSKFISIDQNNKLTNQMSLLKVQSLGITEGIWMHRGGAKVPRPTHLAMHGQKFNLAEGLFDEDEGYFVLPGQMYNCHCAYKPVLPDVLQPEQPEQPEQSEQPVIDDLYSQERKDNALWAKTHEEADKVLREKTGEIWKKLSKDQKEALYEYSDLEYRKMNAVLVGFERGRYSGPFLGQGNVPLDSAGEYIKNYIINCTSAIEESKLTTDMWVNRGVTVAGLNNMLRDILPIVGVDDLSKLTDLSILENETVLMNSFVSTTATKGSGASERTPVIMNFYIPQGSEAMYMEPFAKTGRGDGLRWDGDSPQTEFSDEMEVLLQRGGYYKILRAYRDGEKIYIDFELRLEEGYNKYGQPVTQNEPIPLDIVKPTETENQKSEQEIYDELLEYAKSRMNKNVDFDKSAVEQNVLEMLKGPYAGDTDGLKKTLQGTINGDKSHINDKIVPLIKQKCKDVAADTFKNNEEVDSAKATIDPLIDEYIAAVRKLRIDELSLEVLKANGKKRLSIDEDKQRAKYLGWLQEEVKNALDISKTIGDLAAAENDAQYRYQLTIQSNGDLNAELARYEAQMNEARSQCEIERGNILDNKCESLAIQVALEEMSYAAAVDKVERDARDFKVLLEVYGEAKTRFNIFEGLIKGTVQPETSIKLAKPDTEQKVFSEADYNQDKKDNAMWEKDSQIIDDRFFVPTSEQWLTMTISERKALMSYTTEANYVPINSLLNGFKGGNYKGDFVAPGSVNLDENGVKYKNLIINMTNALAKCRTPQDVWVQRGVDVFGLRSFFGSNIITSSNVSDISQDDISQMIGKSGRLEGFVSTSLIKGGGFTTFNTTMNIYIPAGAQAIYVEPFSLYDKPLVEVWDGISKKGWLGEEMELLIQRGATYTCTRAYKQSGHLYLDFEMHPEYGYNTYGQ